MTLTTEEGNSVTLVMTNIQDRIAQRLFYQCHFHIALYSEFVKRFHESKEKLDFHNFARANTCHMLDGPFGEFKQSHQMERYKVQAIGNLGMFLSTGHKFLRSFLNGLNRESPPDFRIVKRQVSRFEEEFRASRNAYEHLDQGINSGKVSDDMDFSFSIHNTLNFRDDKGNDRLMDISRDRLLKVCSLWVEFTDALEGLRDSRPASELAGC